MARPSRRVRTEPQPGVDPHPQRIPAAGPEASPVTLAGEDRDLTVYRDATTGATSDSNDDRLRSDVPPHHV